MLRAGHKLGPIRRDRSPIHLTPLRVNRSLNFVIARLLLADNRTYIRLVHGIARE